MSFNYENFKENEVERLKNELLNKYIEFDNNYFYNYDKKLYKVGKRRNRTVWTPYGKLTYPRRIYINKENGITFTPTDLEFGIEPYSRIINNIKNKIINELGKGKRNQDIKDMIPNLNVSLMTISNILKKSKF